jgi:TP901 family phage tail tape measure protein
MEEQIIVEIKVDRDEVVNAEKAFNELNKRIDLLGNKIANARKENKSYKKEITSLTKELKKGNITTEEYTKQVNNLNGKIEKNNKLISTSSNTLKQLKREQQANLNLMNAESGTLNQLSAKRNLLNQQIRKTSQDTKAGRKEYEKLRKELSLVNRQIQSQNEKFGNFRESIGKYPRVLQKAGSALKSFVGAFGLAGGVTMFINILRDGLGVITNFTTAVSELGSVSGASKEELAELTEQAKQLAVVTKFTASEVIKAQTELARLGFTVDEIKNSVPGILDLGAAFKQGLGDSAQVAGGIIRAFGMDAKEMTNVVDGITRTLNNSGASFEDYREAVKLAAPIFKSANIDFKTMNQLIGTLADSQLKGSITGTGLKNLISKLSNPTSKLSKEIGFAVKNSDDLQKAFKVLKERNIDLTAATELTDERSKAAFLTLLNGVDPSSKLAKALDDVNITAKDTANTMIDNLAGDTAIFRSTWEGLILSMEDGTGSFNKVLRGLVQFGTAILSSLMKGNSLTKTIKGLFSSFAGLGKALNSVAKLFGSAGDQASLVEGIFDILGTTLTIATTPMRLVIWILTEIIDVIVDFVNESETLTSVIQGITGFFGGLVDGIKDVLKFLGILDREIKKVADTQKDFSSALVKELTKQSESLEKARKKEVEGEKKKNEEVKKERDKKAKDEEKAREKRLKELEKHSKDILKLQEKENSDLEKIIDDFDKEQDKLNQEQIDSLFELNILRKQIAADREKDEIERANKLIEIEKLKNEKIINDNQLTGDKLKLQNLKLQIEIEKILQDSLERQAATKIEKEQEEQERINGLVDSARARTEELANITNEFSQELGNVFKELTDTIFNLFDTKKIGVEEGLEIVKSAISTIDGFLSNSLNNQLKDLEKQKNAELKIAGDNADAREAIELEFDRKSREIKKKQAILDKANALAQIAINTALGVTAALSTANIPLSIIIGGLGLAQGAIVANTPLPEFKHGTSDIVGIGGSHESGNDVTVFGRDKSGNTQVFGKVEKGERMPVIPKNQAFAYSSYNNNLNDYLAKRTFQTGTQDIMKLNQASTEKGLTIEDIERIVSRIPQQVLLQEDVNDGLDRQVELKENSEI